MGSVHSAFFTYLGLSSFPERDKKGTWLADVAPLTHAGRERIKSSMRESERKRGLRLRLRLYVPPARRGSFELKVRGIEGQVSAQCFPKRDVQAKWKPNKKHSLALRDPLSKRAVRMRVRVRCVVCVSWLLLLSCDGNPRTPLVFHRTGNCRFEEGAGLQAEDRWVDRSVIQAGVLSEVLGSPNR